MIWFELHFPQCIAGFWCTCVRACFPSRALCFVMAGRLESEARLYRAVSEQFKSPGAAIPAQGEHKEHSEPPVN